MHCKQIECVLHLHVPSAEIDTRFLLKLCITFVINRLMCHIHTYIERDTLNIIFKHLYIYIYIYIYIHTYTFTYIYIYIYMYTHKPEFWVVCMYVHFLVNYPFKGYLVRQILVYNLNDNHSVFRKWSTIHSLSISAYIIQKIRPEKVI